MKKSSLEIARSEEIKKKIDMHSIPEPNTGCWIWFGRINRKGYGEICTNNEIWIAHRLSYKVFNGPIGDFHVLHKCDMPACVNPRHLFLGTNLDNIADRVAKNRSATGVNNGRSKVTKEQVLSIRRIYSEGKDTTTALGIRFGIDRTTIGRIVNRKHYKNVK